MSQVPVWFERKFEFLFPVELRPNLLVRLRGAPARLEEIFRGRSAKIAVRKLDKSGRPRNTLVIFSIWSRYGWRG